MHLREEINTTRYCKFENKYLKNLLSILKMYTSFESQNYGIIAWAYNVCRCNLYVKNSIESGEVWLQAYIL